jgi:nicotinamide mononucleotide adenylyltransferase
VKIGHIPIFKSDFLILILNQLIKKMELILKLNKKQLKVFTDLADKLNIKHFVVNDDIEDEAIYKAMQDGDQNIAEDPDLREFENWLKE